MSRLIGVLVVVFTMSAQAQDADAGAPDEHVVDAGAPDAQSAAPAITPPVAVDAGTLSAGFDVVTTPWGPGRKSSGEVFRTVALPSTEGPLRWTWNDFSVAIGAQYLARGELRDNADFSSSNGDHSLGFEQRARLSVRASAKRRVGVLLELQDVRAWGIEPNTATLTPNTGLHQGFVDLKATQWLDVRVGRQELSYGEDRLIGSLDWSMTGRTFDGVFLRVTATPNFTIDGFGMMLKPPAWVSQDGGGRFHNSGSYFTGLYARARFGKLGFDVYGLGLLEDPSTAATGLQRDANRLTLGARLFGAFGGLQLVGEGAWQTGQVKLDSVSAGAFAAKATYTLNQVFGAPYVMVEFSGASGDGDGTDGVEHTFNQLFPTGHTHLGYMDYVGWQNVVAVRGTVGFRPWGAHLWVDVHNFHAWDPRGAWYAANGSVFLAADAMRTSGEMGTEVDASLTVPIVENISLAANFSVFIPGAEAAAKGNSASTWGFLYLRTQL